MTAPRQNRLTLTIIGRAESKGKDFMMLSAKDDTQRDALICNARSVGAAPYIGSR